ncbi:F-box-like domain protein, putative [Rhizoctonia solani AG-3 Rhs1AP]|uniref:F-box-like domain protein, putative n=2 Tax=Rhizoctonia solani AG-3 TaxID=1086053 RepID=X8J4Q9_9AGAM|nr:F-box-like domain protein, putative [Rhizoctonia solani AG-3 Rhs1AP]KEP51017.1 putative F-box-like domain protein [Rhizoctonia solani 123E]
MQPVPCKRTALYLNRSGSTALLDIKIVIFSPQSPGKGEKLENLRNYSERVRKTFAFIVKHGGSSSRWRSLCFGTDIFASCSAAVDLLSKAGLSSLESLEIVFMGPWQGHPEDDKMFLDAYRGKSSSKLLFAEPPPQLGSVRLEGVINSHLFGDISRPQLAGLTDIYISFSGRHPGINHIHSMLAASPRLTKLCFNSGDTDPDEDGPNAVQALDTPKVHMPTLKTLSFLSISSPVWVLNHLLTLDAPNMTTFKLTFGEEPEEWFNGGRGAIRHLISYIATSGPVGTKRTPRPLFPSLTHITFSNSERFQEDLEMFLAGYPKIDSLALPECPTLQPLVKATLGLANLKVGIKEVTELKDFLLARREAGVPLRTVQVARSRLGGPIDASVLKELEELVEFSLVDELEED